MKKNYLSDEFLNSIWLFYEANLSVRTRKEYFAVINNYAKITENDPLHLSEKSAACYYQYIEKRLQEHRLSYSTALMRISVMRTLCEYIRYKKEREGQSYINYFNNIILPDSNKTITDEMLPSLENLDALLKIVKEHQDDKAFLIFSLVMKCGLTSSEVSSLNTEFLMIDMNNCFCIRFPTKKSISRIIKLPDDISSLLNSYIDQSGTYNGALFLNKRNNRLKVRDTERLLQKYISLGIQQKRISQHFTMQSMRHSAFKYMLSGGATQEEVAAYGGITTKWMSRYNQIVTSNNTSKTADLSVLKIKT